MKYSWANFELISGNSKVWLFKEWENCSLLCIKVKLFIEFQNVKFDEKISSGHNNKMGAKDDRKVKTYKILI